MDEIQCAVSSLIVKLDVGHLDLYMEKWSEPVWPKHGDVVQNDSYMGIKSMSVNVLIADKILSN